MRIKIKKPKARRLTAAQVLATWEGLSHQGTIKHSKPVIVFGPTPGAVTEVTVGVDGNLTLVYEPLKKPEMDGR